MSNVLTALDLSNNKFVRPTARGDGHRQEAVFDKGDLARGLSKKTTPQSNDLSRRRWRGPILDQQTERDLIRRAKSNDPRAKQRLIEAFHRLVLSEVGEYSGPPHNDLMAAGLFGFVEAISRFNENRGRRLSTYAGHWIRKYILLAIQDWQRKGAAGETRQDRYLFSNPRATAEEIVAAKGGTLADAEKAIARLNAGHDSYDTGEGAFDEDGKCTGPKVATSHDMRHMFDCFSAHQLSPQIRGFNAASKWIDSLARKAGTGRQYPPSYLYRTATEIGERAKIAARMLPAPVFAETGDKPVVTAKLQQYELDVRVVREKTARLKALRLANPKPPPERKRKKAKWHDTRTIAPEKSLPSPSRPALQLRCGSFAKKNLSHSATFVELRCSAA